MAKTAMIVTVCVVSVVILFVIFSYLLSIVNPGLMVTNGTRYRKAGELQEFDDDKSDILYPNEELSAKDNVHFGLEKVPHDYELLPYEVESKENAEIGKRFAQKPVRISDVTVKSTIRHVDQLLTTDGKNPVSLIVYPLKDNRRPAREKNYRNMGRNPKNVILKIVDDRGRPKLEVIADSAQLVFKQEGNNTKKESDSKIIEIRPNNTLLYNVKDQTFKIVDNKTPYVKKISTFRSKDVEQGVEKSSTNVHSTDEMNSTLTVTNPTPEIYFPSTKLISNNLSSPTELSSVNDNLNTVTVIKKK